MNLWSWLGVPLGYFLLFVASVAVLWSVSLLVFGVLDGFSGGRVNTLSIAAGTALVAGAVGWLLLRPVGGTGSPRLADTSVANRDDDASR